MKGLNLGCGCCGCSSSSTSAALRRCGGRAFAPCGPPVGSRAKAVPEGGAAGELYIEPQSELHGVLSCEPNGERELRVVTGLALPLLPANPKTEREVRGVL